MGSRDYYKSGDWNVRCAACKKKYKRSELIQRWDGLWVGQECWEIRNPQEYLRNVPEDRDLDLRTPESPAATVTESFSITDEGSTAYSYYCGTDVTMKQLALRAPAPAAPAAITYAVNGRVYFPIPLGLENVLITMTGAASSTDTTDPTGEFGFTGLAAGSYTFTPSLAGYTFDPTDRSVTITTYNVNGVEFDALSGFACPAITYTPAVPVERQRFGEATASIGQGAKRTLSINEDGLIVASGVPSHTVAPLGRVNIWRRSGTTYSLDQAITNPWAAAAAADLFGQATALSYDGTYLAVGSPGETATGTPATDGRVAIYKYNGSTYAKIQDIGPSDDPASADFGIDLAISGDGLTLVVGAQLASKCYVYTNTADVYTEIKILSPSEASGGSYGTAVDISGDGNYIAIGDKGNDVGGANVGVCYIYERDTGGADNFGEQQVIHHGGSWAGGAYAFGSDVALSCDGTYLVSGVEGANRTAGSAPGGLNEGSAEVWIRSAATWALRAAITQHNASFTSGSGLTGESVAISGNGDRAYMGGGDADGYGLAGGGGVEYAGWNGTSYIPAYTPTPTGLSASDFVGRDLVLSRDGKILIAGAPGDDVLAASAGSLFYFEMGA